MFPYDAGRKPGRPKAIPQAIVPKVIALYKQGLGYRGITRELKKENLSVNWSTMRRLIKKQLWTNCSRISARCSNVVPPDLTNTGCHGITNCLKKSESTKCLIKPVDPPDIHICIKKALNQLSQHSKNRTD